MTNARELMKGMSKKRQEAIMKEAAELIAEERTLRALRQLLHLTQVEMAEILETSQNAVSRTERQSDLLISTLNKYVDALGGELQLVAKFPNRPPVSLKFEDLTTN